MGGTKALLGGGLLAATLIVAVVLLRPAGVQDVRLVPDDESMVAQGAQIYAAECASCHGADLEGQPDWRSPGPDGLRPAPPHDASGHTWHHDDTTLFILTKHGLAGVLDDPPLSGMPAYEEVLTDEEIVAVLSYIKSNWPDEIRARHDDMNDQAGP
ncbi:cytochrome c [Roseicyclus sp. F158]|uniref:Cytochrome c n=1 Tax=Tropicimonas omnivorans TaxID=3075590 RepID=A0ABU3DH98_9RHOB|nr:cytochrome c [Roseicyclus sp. F158]MDT0683092.1 cytochrome c [Roseicyclus sp. F158]